MDKEIRENSRILIVDDQPPGVLLIERMLQQAGFTQLVCLTDSREVVEQFRIFKPDLILLDLMMPRLDGYAVMSQLRGWIPDDVYLPILVITADVSRGAKQKALSLGAKDFLTKPIDTTEATLRVHNLLETRWLYRKLQMQNRLLVEQVRISKKEFDEARAQLDRIGEGYGIPAAQMESMRAQLVQALATIERIGETVETYHPGQILQLSGSEAADWIERGWAKPV
ncbi:MAG: response regulator [Acidobacteriia bacterium]|nr:response regulator [Terriglobia bacterium]